MLSFVCFISFHFLCVRFLDIWYFIGKHLKTKQKTRVNATFVIFNPGCSLEQPGKGSKDLSGLDCGWEGWGRTFRVEDKLSQWLWLLVYPRFPGMCLKLRSLSTSVFWHPLDIWCPLAFIMSNAQSSTDNTSATPLDFCLRPNLEPHLELPSLSPSCFNFYFYAQMTFQVHSWFFIST
jgi:hypothetical protein